MKSIFALTSVAALATPGLSQITLGTAAAFGAIAGDSFTNTGNTVITGNVGSVDGSILGFPPGVFTGVEEFGANAQQPHTDARSAFSAARALTPTTNFDAHTAELDGETFAPGVFAWEQGASVNGVVTLNGSGTFVFQIPSSLATTDNSQLVLTGGAQASDIWWTVGNDAVLGANSTFVGNLIAGPITLGSGATVEGGIYSLTHIVTVDNTITGPA